MRLFRLLSLAGGILVLGCGCGRAWAQAPDDEPLRLEPPLNGSPRETPPATVETPRVDPGPVTPPSDAPDRVPQAPPAPLADAPRGAPPTPGARWTEGYWDWDASRNQYTWIGGSWRVPPPGKTWVNGSWKRDDRGWYRVAGSWSDRREPDNDWRRSGPPADRPAEAIGPPPRPGAFYIPGTHIPAGDRVVWRPGFWTPAQPGWEWIPARWVRLSEGWSFREGRWNRISEAGSVSPFATNSGGPRPAPGNRYSVARPALEPTSRRGADVPTDLQPIPDADLTRARAESSARSTVPPASARRPDPNGPSGPTEEPGGPVDPVEPRASSPAPLVIRPGLPVPYWDGRRLVVPPTRFGPGVIVDGAGPLGANPSPYPVVGVLPPRGPGRGYLPDGRPIPPGGPRPGPLGGLVRGLLGRARP